MSQFLLIHYHDIFTYYQHLSTFYINGAIQPFKKFPTSANPHPKKYLKGAI